MNCSAGFTTPTDGAVLPSDCNIDIRKSCPPGEVLDEAVSRCVVCSPGFFNSGGESVCFACAAGKFQPSFSASSRRDPSSCLSCPSGRFSRIQAATSISVCGLCRDGFKPTEDYSACEGCKFGQFYDSKTGGCLPCSSLSSSSSSSSAATLLCAPAVSVPLPRPEVLSSQLPSLLEKLPAAAVSVLVPISGGDGGPSRRELSAAGGSGVDLIAVTIPLSSAPPLTLSLPDSGSSLAKDANATANGTTTHGFPPPKVTRYSSGGGGEVTTTPPLDGGATDYSETTRAFFLAAWSLPVCLVVASSIALLLIFLVPSSVEQLFASHRWFLALDLFHLNKPLEEGEAVRKLPSSLGTKVTFAFLFGLGGATLALVMTWAVDNAVYSSTIRALPASFEWEKIVSPLELTVAFAADAGAGCNTVEAFAENGDESTATTELLSSASAYPLRFLSSSRSLASSATGCIVRIPVPRFKAPTGGVLARLGLRLPPSAQSGVWFATGIATPAASKVTTSDFFFAGGTLAVLSPSPRGISGASIALTVSPFVEEDRILRRTSYGLTLTQSSTKLSLFSEASLDPGTSVEAQQRETGGIAVEFTIASAPQETISTVLTKTSVAQLLASLVGLLSGLGALYSFGHRQIYIVKEWRNKRSRSRSRSGSIGIDDDDGKDDVAGDFATPIGADKKASVGRVREAFPIPVLRVGGSAYAVAATGDLGVRRESSVAAQMNPMMLLSELPPPHHRAATRTLAGAGSLQRLSVFTAPPLPVARTGTAITATGGSAAAATSSSPALELVARQVQAKAQAQPQAQAQAQAAGTKA